MNWNACLIFLAWFAKTEFTAIPTRRILHIGNGCIATSIPELTARVATSIVSPATLCRSILLPELGCSTGTPEKNCEQSTLGNNFPLHFHPKRDSIRSGTQPEGLSRFPAPCRPALRLDRRERLLRPRNRHRAASPACSGGDPVSGEDGTVRHDLRESLPSASAAVS